MTAPRRLRAAWAARPAVYSRRTWAFLLALDRLPWPWGEEIMGLCFVARAFVNASRLRQALAWGSAHRGTRRGRWALALASCSCHGRFVARSAFTGIRDTEALRRVVSLRGEEHLPAGGRGVIFLGFHHGPTRPDVALRIAGYRVTWVGAVGQGIRNRSSAAAWPAGIQHLFEISGEHGSVVTPPPSGSKSARLRALYRAHGILSRGESIFMTADGPGTVAFELPLPGGRALIRAGWLLLRETTGAAVLPVLSHMEGRTQVVTVYPPLPPSGADASRDLEACREVLGSLLADHVRRFPEQCYLLAFPAMGSGGPAGRDMAGTLAAGRAASGSDRRSTHG
jgi:lauroyl/myristoyl acyltransferase